MKQSKYKNKRCEFGGKKFPSIREMMRYKALLVAEHAGQITELRTQVRYLLVEDKAAGFKLTYVADFVYKDWQGKEVVNDAKGYKTAVFKQKARIMKKKFGIDILCT